MSRQPARIRDGGAAGQHRRHDGPHVGGDAGLASRRRSARRKRSSSSAASSSRAPSTSISARWGRATSRRPSTSSSSNGSFARSTRIRSRTATFRLSGRRPACPRCRAATAAGRQASRVAAGDAVCRPAFAAAAGRRARASDDSRCARRVRRTVGRSAARSVRRRGGQTGGGIMGVVSKSKESSIRVYHGGTHYNEWTFLFSNVSNRPGVRAAVTARPEIPGGQRGHGGRGNRGESGKSRRSRAGEPGRPAALREAAVADVRPRRSAPAADPGRRRAQQADGRPTVSLGRRTSAVGREKSSAADPDTHVDSLEPGPDPIQPSTCRCRVASWRRGTSNCRDAFRSVPALPSVSRNSRRRLARPRHRPVAGHGAEHDRHDRRRAVRHHPADRRDDARAAGDARAGSSGALLCRLRRAGLGGARRGDAAGRRARSAICARCTGRGSAAGSRSCSCSS